MMVHELTGIAYITASALGVLACAEMLQKYTSISGELSRKIAHAGCGIVLLLIPTVINSHWSVLALSSSFAALMWMTRIHGLLRGVHGVSRGPGGVLSYPIAAWLAYWLAFDVLERGYVVYAIPIAILAFADAAGALIGRRWGRHRYEVSANHFRSVEGSLAVCIVAWMCVVTGLVLAGHRDAGYTVLLATAVALTATMLETVSIGGLDNALLPIGTLLLLDHLYAMAPSQIIREIVLLIVCSGVVAATTWRRTAPVGGATSIALSLYLVWSVGGAAWITPSAATLAVFTGFQRATRAKSITADARTHLPVMIAGLAIPVALAIASHLAEARVPDQIAYVAYVASLGCTTAILLFILPQHHRFRWTRVRRMIATRSLWSYTPTSGKMVLACVGAAIPVMAMEVGHGSSMYRIASSSEFTLASTALVCALAGLIVFLILAARLTRSHRMCSVCGMVDIVGATCCRGASTMRTVPGMAGSAHTGSTSRITPKRAVSLGETLFITQVMTALSTALVVAWLGT